MKAALVLDGIRETTKFSGIWPLGMVLMVLCACDGEPPLDLQGGRVYEDTSPNIDPLDVGVLDAAPLEFPDGICPDLEIFETDVVLQVDSVCGACHATDHNPSNNYFEWYSPGRVGDLTPRQIQDNLEETLRLVDFGNPSESPLFAYHRDKGDTHGVFTPTRAEVVTAWLNNATMDCPDDELDAGVMGGPGQASPCGPNVDPERYGTPTSREAWFGPGGVNQLLVGTGPLEPGKCGDATCHGGQDVGGMLWFATEANAAAEACNLQVVEVFINRVDIDASELLVKPLGETPVTPEGGIHGGQTVFRGRDDPAYIRLRNWIIEGGLR